MVLGARRAPVKDDARAVSSSGEFRARAKSGRKGRGLVLAMLRLKSCRQAPKQDVNLAT